MSLHSTPAIPDYVRCGSALYYVTWPRLVTVCLTALISVIVLSEIQVHLPVESDLARDSGPGGLSRPPPYDTSGSGSGLHGGREGGIRGLLGKAASRFTGGGGGKKGKEKSGTASDAAPTVMPSWCASKGSLYYLDKWKLVYLGKDESFPDADVGNPHADSAGEDADAAGNQDAAGAKVCDWVPSSKIQAEFPFTLCTFDKTVDTQISAFIHKEGHWNGGKKQLLESLLPRVNEMMEMPERTMVIDVGANIGFYTMLAAARGYDVMAVEPSKDAALRLLHSLEANGIRTARSGIEKGVNTGHTRSPVAYVYQNAGSDTYNSAGLHFMAENPGASWLEQEGRGETVTTVPLDDLLDAGARDSSGGAHPGAKIANVINAGRVRLLKVSAEGWDARALHGARRLLSLGRVPYVHFVFNSDHIKQRGCDPRGLILSLFGDGYRLYHGSVFIYREKELTHFLNNMAGFLGGGTGENAGPVRSVELMFVREGAPFAM